MIPQQQRRSDSGTDQAVRASVGAFFLQLGGRVLPDGADIPEGHLGISFDSGWLFGPIVGVFEDLTMPLNAAQTLTHTERGPVEVRLRLPSSATSSLAFLSSCSNSARPIDETPSQLLSLSSPNTPFEELQRYLQKTEAEIRTEGYLLGGHFQEKVALEVSTGIQRIVLRYYAQIDRGGESDLDAICEMFGVNALYDRAGDLFDGREAIAKFYREDRKLSGVHTISDIKARGLTVEVEGTFVGRSLRDDCSCTIAFTDRWMFDLRGCVSHRTTCFETGREVVSLS